MITKNIEKALLLFNVNLPINFELLENAFYDIITMPEVKERDIFLASFLSFLMDRQNKEEIKSCISAICKLENLDMPIHLQTKNVMALCGSGKKGIKTINISTPSAIIASSLGTNIIKPGSKSTSSRTGSADFFSVIGVQSLPNVNIDDMLKEVSFSFISIEDSLKTFDKVYGHRFYIPTVLGFVLSALSLPVQCDKIIYGLAHPNQDLSYNLIQDICKTPPVIVTTTIQDSIYLDEIAYGQIVIRNHLGQNIEDPSHFIPGWNNYSIQNLAEQSTSEDNVYIAVKALKGKAISAIEDIYSLNSALYLKEMGIVSSLEDGYQDSKKAIKSGHAYDHFRKVLKLLGGNLSQIERI